MMQAARTHRPAPAGVYCGMRVLCVGRHTFLSEHLCRYFTDLGTECSAVDGAAGVPTAAADFEPHVVVCDSDLLTPALLDTWGRNPALEGTAVLAVSLTRRPEEGTLPVPETGVIYLPGLEREQALALLAAAYRPRGVQSPPAWQLDARASATAC